MTRLVELVGKSTALEWLGSQAIINSETAHLHGLINHIVSSGQLESFTVDFAKKLCSNDRNYIRSLKSLALHACQDEREISFAHELEVFSRFWDTQEHFDRLDKFLKRKINK